MHDIQSSSNAEIFDRGVGDNPYFILMMGKVIAFALDKALWASLKAWSRSMDHDMVLWDCLPATTESRGWR